MDKDDWEQVELFHKSKLPIKAFEGMPHGHIKAADLRPHMSRVWNDYFKFAIVRNPFERFVSTCFFMNKNNKVFLTNPTAFMKLRFRDYDFLNDSVYMPQTEYLKGQNGEMAMDFLGDFASLQKSFDQIAQKVGLAHKKLNQINQSVHKEADLYFDSELKELIADYYAEDIALYKTVHAGFGD